MNFFHKEIREIGPEVRIENGRPIVNKEIEWTLYKTRRGKEAGNDSVFVELVRAMVFILQLKN